MLVILGIGAYVYMMRSGVDYSALDYVDKVRNIVEVKDPTDFEALPEPTGTPEVINNAAVAEMDAFMNDVDAASEGEDFSDLGF